jgi:hypothetical protein
MVWIERMASRGQRKGMLHPTARRLSTNLGSATDVAASLQSGTGLFGNGLLGLGGPIGELLWNCRASLLMLAPARPSILCHPGPLGAWHQHDSSSWVRISDKSQCKADQLLRRPFHCHRGNISAALPALPGANPNVTSLCGTCFFNLSKKSPCHTAQVTSALRVTVAIENIVANVFNV